MCPGPGEGSRGQQDPGPMSEGLSQDILQSFGIQECQEDLQDLHLALAWEQSIPLFSREMMEFLPVNLGDLYWSSRERNLSGHLVESLCQEIGLVAFMFFFELLFFLCLFAISFYVSLTNLFSIILFLIC